MRAKGLLSVIIAMLLLSVLPSCTVDPSPEAYRVPEFGLVTVDESELGVVEFCYPVSPMSQVTDCGLYYREAGDEAAWLKAPGIHAGADTFKVRIDNLADGATYSYRLFVSNGRAERLSDPMTYVAPDNGFGRDPMVLQVQAGADGKVWLPLRGSVKCKVDWGDGTHEVCVGEFGAGTLASGCISHTYASPESYVVTAAGTVTALSGFGLPSGSVKAVLAWGDTGLTDMSCAFQGQEMLCKLAAPCDGAFASVASFRNAFSGTGITGLPAGFFDSCPNDCDYTRVFASCKRLQSLPDPVFPSAESLLQCFTGCSSLKSLPARLCADGSGVRVMQEVFSDCTSLQSVPGTLLVGFTGLERMVSVFAGCTSLSGLPAGLFDDCRLLTVTEGVFMNCSSLSGESPYTVIDGVKVHLYERNAFPEHFAAINSCYLCYFGCTGLSDYDGIPASWKKAY